VQAVRAAAATAAAPAVDVIRGGGGSRGGVGVRTFLVVVVIWRRVGEMG
jgi:hypothetical protein